MAATAINATTSGSDPSRFRSIPFPLTSAHEIQRSYAKKLAVLRVAGKIILLKMQHFRFDAALSDAGDAVCDGTKRQRSTFPSRAADHGYCLAAWTGHGE